MLHKKTSIIYPIYCVCWAKQILFAHLQRPRTSTYVNVCDLSPCSLSHSLHWVHSVSAISFQKSISNSHEQNAIRCSLVVVVFFLLVLISLDKRTLLTFSSAIASIACSRNDVTSLKFSFVRFLSIFAVFFLSLFIFNLLSDRAHIIFSLEFCLLHFFLVVFYLSAAKTREKQREKFGVDSFCHKHSFSYSYTHTHTHTFTQMPVSYSLCCRLSNRMISWWNAVLFAFLSVSFIHSSFQVCRFRFSFLCESATHTHRERGRER